MRNALRAVELAIRIAPDPRPLRERLKAFHSSGAATEIRNVFEHFDAYFVGEGRLQEGLAKLHSLGPRISILERPGIKTFTVTVGEHELRIPAVTEATDELFWDIEQLLLKQAETKPRRRIRMWPRPTA